MMERLMYVDFGAFGFALFIATMFVLCLVYNYKMTKLEESAKIRKMQMLKP